MSVIHAPNKREIGLREVLPLVIVGIALAVILIRLWYIQVVIGEDLSERGRALRTSEVSRLAPRGLIYDRNGTLVAGIQPEIVLTAVPSAMNRNPWVLAKVAGMIGVPVEKLQEKVKSSEWRPHLPATIHVGVPIEIAARIVENSDALPGIGVESQPMRVTLDTKSLCHLLGYVWTPVDRDVERLSALDIKPADYVGRDGLERVYERELMGTPGTERLEFDAKRRPLRVIERDSPIPGNRLILSLDLKLQQRAQQLLAGKSGAAVAIDPSTGEVLCMVSSPGFDAKVFQRGISTANWKKLQSDEGHPMINRAIGSRYSPGSTFKIVVAIAAMEKGIFSLSRPTVCRGYYAVGNRRSRCLGVHGAITFHNAFARSCNTYFSDLAMRIGPEALTATALRLGLGRKTGIDLPSENPGLVPTQEWLESRPTPLKWYPGDTVNLGIGQGAMAATPLQMALVAGIAAKNGVGYRPHLVRAMLPGKGGTEAVPTPLETLSRVEGPPDFWQALQRAMVSVIDSGTARGAATIPGLEWGGKTGSAEHAKREQTHSWFVGVAPMKDPKIAVCVLVEAAGHGSTVAAPIAREVVKTYLHLEPEGEVPPAILTTARP